MTYERNVLPTTATPTKYVLHLEPDLEKLTFDGQVRIQLDVHQPTDKLTCHAADLTFKSVKLDGSVLSDYAFDEKQERVTFSLASSLRPGSKAVLEIDYAGTLNDKMQGFYRSAYTLPDGSKHFMAVTQFEDTDARRCLPCWDEPIHKATFECSLTVPADRTCLHNTDHSGVEDLADHRKKKYIFHETPKMSTYLLAFVVAHLEHVEAFDSNGVRHRVYTQPGMKDKGLFALDVSTKSFDIFTNFFGVKYPLPKYDQVAVNDFAMGAMENWGLATFRSTALLVDSNSSLQTKQWVALVVAHEASHSWFGNIVTMKWWDGLFLNESFATCMEYEAVDRIFPDWKIWNLFVSTDYMAGLRLNSLENSHPVHCPISDENQVSEIFDAISYSFGCSTLRMLIHYLGWESFRNGVAAYMKKFLYANADPEDLWNTLQQISGKPVVDMMASWNRKTGYPVLIVEGADPSNKRAMKVRQQRFLASGKTFSEDNDEDNPIWHIPLDAHTLITTRRFAYQMPEGHFKLNMGQHGCFRVLYTEEQWREICQAIRSKKLADPVDLTALGSDAFALAKAGMLAPRIVMEVAQALGNAGLVDNNVWGEVSGILFGYRHLLSGDSEADAKHRKQFDAFAVSCLRPALAQVGWEPQPGEPSTVSLTRPIIISGLCSLNDEETVQEARRRFVAAGEAATIHPDIRTAVYCAMVRSFDDVDAMLARLKATNVQEEQVRCIKAMACTHNKETMQRVLGFSLDESVVRSQDVMYVSGGMAAESMAGRESVWQWIQANWPELLRRYGESGAMLGRVLQGSLSGFLSQEKRDDVAAFLQKHPVATIERTIRQTLEAIDNGIAWKKRDHAALVQFMQQEQ